MYSIRFYPSVLATVVMTICLPASGFSANLIDTLWSRALDISPIAESLWCMDVGPAGQVTLAGYSTQGCGDKSITALQFDSSGELSWYDEIPCGGADCGVTDSLCAAIDVDHGIDGAVYVLAKTAGSYPNDAFLLKYSSLGALEWQSVLNTEDTLSDEPIGVETGPSGNIFVLLDSHDQYHNDQSWVVIAIDQDGDSLWARRSYGRDSSEAYPYRLSTATNGDLLISGMDSYYEANDFGFAALIERCSPDGDLKWKRAFDTVLSPFGSQYAVDAESDTNGNVYVLVPIDNEEIPTPIAVVKYDSSGQRVWATLIFDSVNMSYGHWTPSLSVSKTGDAFVSSGTFYPGSRTTFCLRSDGTLRWMGTESGWANFTATGVDFNGAFYLADHDQVRKFDSNGAVLWAETTVTAVAGFAVTGEDRFYVGGNGPAAFSAALYDARDCGCSCHADPACDANTDVADVIHFINVAFRNYAAIPDPNADCPNEITDVDCSGVTDVVDVTKMVNVAFRNASATVEFCTPCSP